MRLGNCLVVLGALSFSLTAAAADFPAKAWRCPTAKKDPNETVRFQFAASAGNASALTVTYQWEDKKSGSWKRTDGTMPSKYPCIVESGKAMCTLKANTKVNRTWVFELATKQWSAVHKANIQGKWHAQTDKYTCKLE